MKKVVVPNLVAALMIISEVCPAACPLDSAAQNSADCIDAENSGCDCAGCPDPAGLGIGRDQTETETRRKRSSSTPPGASTAGVDPARTLVPRR